MIRECEFGRFTEKSLVPISHARKSLFIFTFKAGFLAKYFFYNLNVSDIKIKIVLVARTMYSTYFFAKTQNDLPNCDLTCGCVNECRLS